MARVPGLSTILDAAELISDVRRAFSKIENLEIGQRRLADELVELERRVRELEASMREAKAEIRLDVVKQTQEIVNSVQGQLYKELKEVSIEVDRLKRFNNLDGSALRDRPAIETTWKGDVSSQALPGDK
jgi:predicted RNase H-like nuclease (RuvC/YqgF family)